MAAPPPLPPRLGQALAAVGRMMRDAQGDWWIIAGAAAALHGVAADTVGDIDVLLTARDVPMIRSLPGVRVVRSERHPRFRSDFYASVDLGHLAVEFMGDWVRDAAGWSPVMPATRQPVVIEREILFIPDRANLIGILFRFGRPKDLARIAMLEG